MKLKKIIHKLLASYLLFIGISGAIALVGIWFYQKSESLHHVMNQIVDLQLDTKTVIDYDRQFIMYETINPVFYETGDSPYLQKHKQIFRKFEESMSLLQSNEVATQFTLAQRIDSIGINLAIYDSLYQVMMTKIKERGFKDYGVVGNMREYVHKLEDNQQLGIPLADILTLRRHEKDYIIRNDLEYARKLESKIIELQKRPISKESKLLLQNYLESFQKVVIYDQLIGIKSTTGLSLALKEQADVLEGILHRIVENGHQKQQEMLEATSNRLFQVIILIILVAIIFSYLIARNLTRPLRRLSFTIDQLIESNFDSKTSLIQTNAKDEVGKLTNNFNLMIHKLRQNIKELNKKHAVLEEKNVLLEDINKKLTLSENKLRESNLVKNKFFSIISHDLRGPFNTLKGFLTILSEHADGFSPQEIKTLTKDMSSSVNNLYELTDNLLQWSLAQTEGMKVDMEEVSVYNIAEKNCKLYEHKAIEKLINLENLTKKTIFVWADKNILDFVIRNLIFNALKFTEEGGSIRIISEIIRNEIHITVADSGIGISENNLEKLFKLDEKFTTRGTRSEKGSGLGLLLCKEFLENIEGHIHVSSELGKGTEFTFTLPIYEPEEVENLKDKQPEKSIA